MSCDVYRPAAIEQLKTLAGQVGRGFLSVAQRSRSPSTSRCARSSTRARHYHDVLIVDTAGRLAIDEEMMREIRELHAALKPIETLFVVDAMQGQDAVNVAQGVLRALPLTGVILTKLDGDARGGAALSVRHVTGKPIKFAGVGEKLDGPRAVPSRAHGVAHPRHGRRPVAGRGRAAQRSTATKPRDSPRRSRRARASTSRTSSSRSAR